MLDIVRARGLYAIVDPEVCRGRDPVVVALAILKGGCAAMQLRAKRLAGPELEELARTLLSACHAADVPFIVNDDPELAHRIGASGVHLGQSDRSIGEARPIVGPGARIGLSTHDLHQALSAQQRGADLLGFGPVFPTQSKANPDPVVGLAQLAEVCRTVAVPVVAIGGITLANAARVKAAGPALIAAIGALCGASDPCAAARAMHEIAR